MGSRESPAWLLCRAILIILVAGLAGATLLRLAPGFGIDDRRLDPRFSQRSLDAFSREQPGGDNIFTFYLRFLTGILRGDAGRSAVSGEPVAKLLHDRAPTTIRAVAGGWTLGWIAAFALAAASVLIRRPAMVLMSMVASGSLLSVPSAVLATVCLLMELPPAAAIAAVTFPRLFPHLYELLRAGLAQPHVVLARARGLPARRVFLFHAAPAVVRPALALAGVSVTLAFGASIPVEALADSPGLGQLAWQAALGRDLPVLVSVTLLLTAITVFANTLADIAMARFGDGAA